MAQARPKKITTTGSSSGLTTHIQHGLREGAMLVLVAIALFFLTALVTYSPVDPGWSYTGSRNGIDNAAGVVGAWFSDVLKNSDMATSTSIAPSRKPCWICVVRPELPVVIIFLGRA